MNARSLVAICALLSACSSEPPATHPPASPPAPVTEPPDSPSPEPLPPETARVEGGLVSGVKHDALWVWKGIPFAAPPTGDLRFRPPAPVVPWDGTRAATEFGPPCPQLRDGAPIGDEDCLTLNVWAPEAAASAPVLVWIHGGGNVQGTASDPIYDGAMLAARTGSVVVTIEYRLGALGFFAHDALDAERQPRVSGNYGILDQQAALRWVQANVAAFGGDPSRVLLFGESAGAQDTLVHVTSPRSAGLFHAAAVQSGGIYTTTLAEGKTATAMLVAAVGCDAAPDVAACMRQRSAEDFVRVPTALGPLDRSGIRYTPLVDGYVLSRNGFETMARGEHNHVPIILGTNGDETSQMVPNVSTEQEYSAALIQLYGAERAAKVKLAYPTSRFASPRKALIAVTTDATWTCPARRIARLLTAHQTEPVHRYYFTWKLKGLAGAVVGATHGIDVPFVFHTFGSFDGYAPDPAAASLSNAMQDYWNRLAAHGDPNGAGALTWPRYDAASEPYLHLDETIAVGERLANVDCDAIDAAAQ